MTSNSIVSQISLKYPMSWLLSIIKFQNIRQLLKNISPITFFRTKNKDTSNSRKTAHISPNTRRALQRYFQWPCLPLLILNLVCAPLKSSSSFLCQQKMSSFRTENSLYLFWYSNSLYLFWYKELLSWSYKKCFLFLSFT